MISFTKKTQQYSPLDDASDDAFLGERLEEKPKNARWWKYLCYIAILIATNAISILIDRGVVRNDCTYSSPPSDERSPSPFMSSIDRSYHTEIFNELNFAAPTESEYTRPATMGDDVAAEVDRYWADLGTYEVEVLLPEQFGRYHDISTDHSHSLTGPWQPHTPYTGYPVEIQVSHMLHCLNLVRQGQWYNIEYFRKHSPSFADGQWEVVNNQSIIEAHSGHCIEQLRQYLMCDVDIRLVPFGDLDPNEVGPQPIFAQPKQCRNYDSYWRWLQKHKWDQNPNNHGERGHTPPVISFSGLPGTFHE